MRRLHHNDLNNYRPVYNLCFIAKILEKLLLSQVLSYLNSHNFYNTCQSAYRPGHSTETALLKVVNDLSLSLNKGNISVLALLDFSSAFDAIDHYFLVHRLHTANMPKLNDNKKELMPVTSNIAKRLHSPSTSITMHMSPILHGHATLYFVVWHLFVDP